VTAACAPLPEPVAAQQNAAPPATQPAALSRAELIRLAQQVQEEVAELRGWKFKQPVKTDIYSEAQLRRYIEKRIFEDQLGGGKLEQTEAFLRMVGLLPVDCDMRKVFLDVLLNQVGGFYDPRARTFYMLQRSGVDYGPFVNRMLIAHELTHALDDQYIDLDALEKSRELSEDWSLALGAVVEGSATVLMQHYWIRQQSSADFDPAQIGQILRSEMQRAEPLLTAPRYFSTLLANYLCGMTFIIRGDPATMVDPRAGPRVGQNVLAAAKHPPLSSEQILHPEKYWDTQQRDEPVVVDDADVERWLAAPGRFVVHKNTVGELLCALLTTPEDEPLDLFSAMSPSGWTNDAARGWGGDRFFLLAEGRDAAAAAKELKGLRGVWITLWDTADDRDEFVEDYAEFRPQRSRAAFKLGRRGTVFFYNFDGTEWAALRRTLETSPPKFTKGGKVWAVTQGE